MVELSKSVMSEHSSTTSSPVPVPRTGSLRTEGVELGLGNILSIGRGESVIGRAKIVKDPAKAEFTPGEILIAENTDPNYTPLFRIAAGVITNTGGMTSHAAITAREFKIPGAQLEGATHKIQDGDTVAIDLSPLKQGKRQIRIVKVSS